MGGHALIAKRRYRCFGRERLCGGTKAGTMTLVSLSDLVEVYGTPESNTDAE